jgi:hypothetical protein
MSAGKQQHYQSQFIEKNRAVSGPNPGTVKKLEKKRGD